MVIEKSAIVPEEKVKIPGTEEIVPLSNICKSGGFLNAYEAAKLAASIKPEQSNKKLPKSTLKKGARG